MLQVEQIVTTPYEHLEFVVQTFDKAAVVSVDEIVDNFLPPPAESGWSSTWTFTVRPAAPSNLTAQTASCSQINLYWTDNSGNEEGYKIYRNGSYVG